MNVCGVNRLKLTPNVDNEFIFTIKENGKYTPMPINSNNNKTILATREFNQNYVRNSGSKERIEQTKIIEVGFPYALVLVRSPKTKGPTPPTENLTSNSLWQNTTDNKLYKYGGSIPYNSADWHIVKEKITLGSNELVIELSYDVDVEELPILLKIRTWASSLGYTTNISGNKLTIERNSNFNYTTSVGLSSRQLQSYIQYSPSTSDTYTLLDTTINMDLKFISPLITERIVILFNRPVRINNGVLTSIHIIEAGINRIFENISIVIPGNSVPVNIVNKLNVEVYILSTTSDSFLFKFIRLSDNATVDLVKIPEIYDAGGGKLKLVITANEVDNLISRLGNEVDRYYMKYSYRLLLEANTKINGNFIAEIRKVAVG